jgi:hypothetical protein
MIILEALFYLILLLGIGAGLIYAIATGLASIFLFIAAFFLWSFSPVWSVGLIILGLILGGLQGAR